jgi:hypothetical protein
MAVMKNLIALLAAFAVSGALAQHVPPQAPKGAPDPASFKPLPERKDIVSWKLLSQVELVKQKDRYVPQFAAGVSALDKKEVKLQGFMLPLEMGDKQSHFILAAMPQSCSFCMPGGPEQLVEVKTRKPVAYGFDAIVLTGRLEVLKDDPAGVYYRLTNAEPSK